MKVGITGRIARASARRPRVTIGVWAAVLIVALYFAGSVDQHVTMEVQNLVITESDAGTDLDEAYRPAADGSELFQETVIITSETVRFGDPEFTGTINRVVDALEGIDGIRGFTVPGLGDPFAVSDSGHSVLVPIETVADTSVVRNAVDAIGEIEADGMTILVSGEESSFLAFNDLANEQLARGESAGVIAALVILVVVFGALVAAGIPLGVAIVSIVIALATASVIGRVYELSDGVLTMASMFGLALGIDYSLVSVQRFREELAKGHSVMDAVTIAGATANRAVLLSGATVVISLGGLLLIPSNMTMGVALGAMFVAIASVSAALTLLPAVLRLLGHRVNKGRVPTTHPGKEPLGWQRIARVVVSKPAISAGVGLAILAILAAPLASIRLANPGPESYPEDFVTRQANEILVDEFGWGQSSTVIAIDGALDARTEIDALALAIEADPAFAETSVDYRGDVAFIDTHDFYSAGDRRAEEAIDRLRTDLVPGALSGTDAVAYVTGEQAATMDLIDLYTSRAWAVVAVVLGASFLMLLLMFRSIVIPLKAIALNLLGTAAAFGALVAAYQYGWGSTLLGFPEVDGISPYMPLMIFALLFGLSMDYHVFLLSRIKERHDAGEDNTTAIIHGLGRTGSLITGAAAIMVAVFSGFAAASVPELSQWGFGLAAAVLIDATIIRILLVPSFMAWLGSANWYLPSWLQWLPTLPFEAPSPALEVPEEEYEPALV
ncbi:MAG: MMPL family transporter [Demequinaceae bacterium]|nr:MMPL family transporter [Demequinaceae bacterium]